MSATDHAIRFTYLAQEDLLEAGCLDFRLASGAAESALIARVTLDEPPAARRRMATSGDR